MPEVLFVCVHNAGRSQMPAGLLDHYAKGKVHVRSAGSTTADRELVRSGAAAIIPATSLARTGTPPDTVIYGRTDDGDVIAPLATK